MKYFSRLLLVFLPLLFVFCTPKENENPKDVSQFFTYEEGNFPLILVSSHGGQEKPDWIPTRTCPDAVNVEDANTLSLTQQIKKELESLGYKPYIVINHLHRQKMDANRSRSMSTCGDRLAMESWDLFHQMISKAREDVASKYGKGLLIDIHGHGHSIQQLELGYLLYEDELDLPDSMLNKDEFIAFSSIKNLAFENLKRLSHAQLLRGGQSLGDLFYDRFYPSVPSTKKTSPRLEPYFSGGYITANYSSYKSGKVDAVQIECNFEGVRDNEQNIKKFSKVTAEVIVEFLRLHYFDEL